MGWFYRIAAMNGNLSTYERSEDGEVTVEFSVVRAMVFSNKERADRISRELNRALGLETRVIRVSGKKVGI